MARHRRRRPDTALKLGILSRFAESGLGVAAFCQRESISPSSFYRWRSLLGDSSMRDVVPRSLPSVTRGAASFVDLGALSPSREPLELRLDLGGGVLLHLVRG